jgi:hypothetical protein
LTFLIFVRRKEKNKLGLSCAKVSKFTSDPKLQTPYILVCLTFLTYFNLISRPPPGWGAYPKIQKKVSSCFEFLRTLILLLIRVLGKISMAAPLWKRLLWTKRYFGGERSPTKKTYVFCCRGGWQPACTRPLWSAVYGQLWLWLMLPEGNLTIQAQDLLLWELNPWINSEKAHSLSVQDGRDEIITNDGRNIPWLIQCPQTIHAVKCWSVIVITKQNALLCQV